MLPVAAASACAARPSISLAPIHSAGMRTLRNAKVVTLLPDTRLATGTG
jgi:hypothetical protein